MLLEKTESHRVFSKFAATFTASATRQRLGPPVVPVELWKEQLDGVRLLVIHYQMSAHFKLNAIHKHASP